jgi:hypothetical protein
MVQSLTCCDNNSTQANVIKKTKRNYILYAVQKNNINKYPSTLQPRKAPQSNAAQHKCSGVNIPSEKRASILSAKS